MMDIGPPRNVAWHAKNGVPNARMNPPTVNALVQSPVKLLHEILGLKTTHAESPNTLIHINERYEHLSQEQKSRKNSE